MSMVSLVRFQEEEAQAYEAAESGWSAVMPLIAVALFFFVALFWLNDAHSICVY